MNFFSSTVTSKLSSSELDLAQKYIQKTTVNVQGFGSSVFFKFLLKQAIRDEHMETLLLVTRSDVFIKNPMMWFKLAVQLNKETAAKVFIYESCINLQRAILYLVRSDKLQLLKVCINYTKIRPVDYTISLIEAIHWNKEQILDILLSNADIATSQCLETAVNSCNLNMIKAILSHPTLCPNYLQYIGYITALKQFNYPAAICIVNHPKFEVTTEHIEHALGHPTIELFELLLSKKSTFNPKIVYRAIVLQDLKILHIVIRYYISTIDPILGMICKYDFVLGLACLLEYTIISTDSALSVACKYGALKCIEFLLANPSRIHI